MSRFDYLQDAFAARVADLALRRGAFTRDDHRPLGDYPTMPPGTCYWSTLGLAEVYPELVAVCGELVVVDLTDGSVWRTPHAWNIRTDGAIVDSTLPTLLWPSDITATVYVEGDGTWPFPSPYDDLRGQAQ